MLNFYDFLTVNRWRPGHVSLLPDKVDPRPAIFHLSQNSSGAGGGWNYTRKETLVVGPLRPSRARSTQWLKIT